MDSYHRKSCQFSALKFEFHSIVEADMDASLQLFALLQCVFSRHVQNNSWAMRRMLTDGGKGAATDTQSVPVVFFT